MTVNTWRYLSFSDIRYSFLCCHGCSGICGTIDEICPDITKMLLVQKVVRDDLLCGNRHFPESFDSISVALVRLCVGIYDYEEEYQCHYQKVDSNDLRFFQNYTSLIVLPLFRSIHCTFLSIYFGSFEVSDRNSLIRSGLQSLFTSSAL